MGGPIVRTGTTPEFWANYDRIFGGKKGSAAKSAEAQPAAKKASKTKAKAPKAAKKKK